MKLTYFVEQDDARSEYVFDFIFRTIGIQAQRIENSLNVDIYYGNNPKFNTFKLRIIQNERQDNNLPPDEVIWKELLAGEIQAASIARDVRFDIIGAIKFFLCDLGNDGISYDEHGRISAIDSFQYRHGILSIPIVNLYVLFLKEVIEIKTGAPGTPLWPKGKVCAIGLSHDVDVPDKRRFRANCMWRLQAISDSIGKRQILRSIRSAAGLLKFVLKCRFIKQDFWLFEQIMDEEEKYGMKSTFFFASRNIFHWGANRQFDVSYDIAKGKFKRAFERIKERGFEIGLHASYNAFEAQENFRKEKARLQSLANTQILGLRHHYWYLGPNPTTTLRYHSQAGFAYDTSIAFNDMMGFRRSVALAYYPWSEETHELIRTVQIPTFLMDGNMFHKPVCVSSAVEEIVRQIKIVKEFRGVGAIDWHVRASLPMNGEYRNWGEVYRGVIAHLSEDKEVWVTNLSEILKFVKTRWMKLGFS